MTPKPRTTNRGGLNRYDLSQFKPQFVRQSKHNKYYNDGLNTISFTHETPTAKKDRNRRKRKERRATRQAQRKGK